MLYGYSSLLTKYDCYNIYLFHTNDIYFFILELRITTKPKSDAVPVLSISIIPQQPESQKQEPKKCSISETTTENCYRCKNCKNIILGPNAENLYVEHIMTCLDSNNFECSICFKKFAHKRGLTNHLRLTHLVFD